MNAADKDTGFWQLRQLTLSVLMNTTDESRHSHRHHSSDKKKKSSKHSVKRSREYSQAHVGIGLTGVSLLELPGGAREISEEDYFVKAKEFRVWLVQSKYYCSPRIIRLRYYLTVFSPCAGASM